MTWITIKSNLGCYATASARGDLDLFHEILVDMNQCVRRLDKMGYTSKAVDAGTVVLVKQTFERQLFLIEIAFGDYQISTEEHKELPTDVLYKTIIRTINNTQKLPRKLNK